MAEQQKIIATAFTSKPRSGFMAIMDKQVMGPLDDILGPQKRALLLRCIETNNSVFIDVVFMSDSVFSRALFGSRIVKPYDCRPGHYAVQFSGGSFKANSTAPNWGLTSTTVALYMPVSNELLNSFVKDKTLITKTRPASVTLRFIIRRDEMNPPITVHRDSKKAAPKSNVVIDLQLTEDLITVLQPTAVEQLPDTSCKSGCGNACKKIGLTDDPKAKSDQIKLAFAVSVNNDVVRERVFDGLTPIELVDVMMFIESKLARK